MQTDISTVSLNIDKPAILRWNTSDITNAGVTDVPGCQANQLYQAWNIALDSANTLYITDRFNSGVQKLILGALNATTITDPLFNFTRPSGIVIDYGANLYITDQTLNQVSYFNPRESSIAIVAGISGTQGNGPNQLNEPHGLSLDRSTNTLYIAEYAPHRVRSYLWGGTAGTIVAGGSSQGYNVTQLNNPTAVFFDSLTNSLLIANYGAHNVVRWVLGEDRWTLSAGSTQGISGSTSLLLNNPIDVKLDPMGNIYVADRMNQRIQFFPRDQMNGTTIDGRTGVVGTDSYTLNQLNLYVVDFLNDRVQKFLRY